MKAISFVAVVMSFFTSILFYVVPYARVAELEEGQFYSMGFASDVRLFALGGEESVDHSTESLSRESDSSVFHRNGSLFVRCEEQDPTLRACVEAKISVEGNIDYKAFAFQGRMPRVVEPLTDLELCYVFSEIVASSTVSVPISGKLEEISFVREGETLLSSARITVSFSRLAERYGLHWLPAAASFFLFVPFSVKSTDISVDFERMYLRCDTFDLPEALLIFGCNAAFGQRDYKTLFGEAVRNVFLNAGIYG